MTEWKGSPLWNRSVRLAPCIPRIFVNQSGTHSEEAISSCNALVLFCALPRKPSNCSQDLLELGIHFLGNVIGKGRGIFGRERYVLAALTKRLALVLAQGNDADEQLLFHLFDILFKCFTCRDVKIPRDKRPGVSCFLAADITRDFWRRLFLHSTFFAEATGNSRNSPPNEDNRSLFFLFSNAPAIRCPREANDPLR